MTQKSCIVGLLDWTTGDGTATGDNLATADTDYTSSTGSDVEIVANAAASVAINVPILGPIIVAELDETFHHVTLSDQKSGGLQILFHY